MHGALDDEMPARNVTYGTPSLITNPSRWMMESVKSVPFESLRCILPVSRSRRSLAQFRGFSPSFPSSRVGVVVFVFRGVEFFVVCLERERGRESGKGRSGSFYFLFIFVLGKLLWCEDGEEQELQSAGQKGEEQEPGTASEGTTH